MTTLTLPAGAAAGTAGGRAVELDGARGFTYRYTYVTFTAAPGEANALAVSRDGDTVVFHDDGADMAAGDGCGSIDARTVRCATLTGTTAVYADAAWLGDGDDTAVAKTVLWLDGAAGNDYLAGSRGDGGPGDDTLVGSAGPDSLVGGGGDDRLYGADGDDTLRGDGGSDVLDGGPGTDTVSWVGHAEPLVIDLVEPGPDGAAGEPDTLVAVESVRGGRGPDVIRGTAGSNVLQGGGGADALSGRGGPDELLGGAEDDAISGGAGNDTLEGDDGVDRLHGGAGNDVIGLLSDRKVRTGDRITCGPGSDRVSDPRKTDFVPADCEVVWLDFASVRRVAGTAATALTLEIADLTDWGGRMCSRIRIGDAHGALGALEFPMPAFRRPERVRVPYTAAGRRVAARPGAARVQLRFRGYTGRCGAREPDEFDGAADAYEIGL